ncbi:hypothetical protein ACF0H5_015993 [Mactra antiquata]
MEVPVVMSFMATLFFISMTSLVLTVEALCPECTKTDLDNTKTACQYLAVALIDTEEDGNTTDVCNALHELLLCIADKTPQCLDRVGQEYRSYRMTPWMCQLTADQTILYQERHENGCQYSYIQKTESTTAVVHNVAEVYQNNSSHRISFTESWFIALQVLVSIIIYTSS